MILQTILNEKGVFKSDYLQDNILNLLDMSFKFPDEYTYNVFEVTEDYISRPDLISYDAYGDTMYSDIICKINGVSNPFELNAGMILIIPDINSIGNFIRTPSLSEKESGAFDKSDSFDKPIAKQKNQKRKANEAVVGDSRFKIDPVAGIVIY